MAMSVYGMSREKQNKVKACNQIQSNFSSKIAEHTTKGILEIV